MTFGDDLEYCSVHRSFLLSLFSQEAERVAVEMVSIAVIDVTIVTIVMTQSVWHCSKSDFQPFRIELVVPCYLATMTYRGWYSTRLIRSIK